MNSFFSKIIRPKIEVTIKYIPIIAKPSGIWTLKVVNVNHPKPELPGGPAARGEAPRQGWGGLVPAETGNRRLRHLFGKGAQSTF